MRYLKLQLGGVGVRRWEEWVYDVVGIFTAALNRVIDDFSNS